MTTHWSVLVPLRGGSFSKSRLALTPPLRAHFALAFARDTLAAVQAAQVAQVCVVTVDPACAQWGHERGVQVVPDPGGGLNAAVRSGLAQLDPTHGHAVLLADLPALTAIELDAALEAASRQPKSLVVDQSGTGTTLLTGTPGAALEPHFGVDSAQAHIAAGHLPLPGALVGLRSDVDTLGDLAAIVDHVGPATAAVLREYPHVFR